MPLVDKKTIRIIRESIESSKQMFYGLSDLTEDREKILGLTYQKGETVYDKRTGTKFIIIAGTRKSIAVSTS